MSRSIGWLAAVLAFQAAVCPMRASALAATQSDTRACLEKLASAEHGAYGATYDASRPGDAPTETAGATGRYRGVSLARPEAGPRGASAVVPSPKADEKEKGKGGFMGFVSKHKFTLGGAALGGLLGFLFGGPIGALVGAAALAQIGYFLSK
jgi:hypothetical protein